MKQLERAQFFEDIIAGFGREKAQIMCEQIIDSINEGERLIPLKRPIDGLKLSAKETEHPIIGFSLVESNGFQLNISPSKATAPTPNLRASIDSVVKHELTHVAHEQLYPNYWQDSEAEIFLFGIAIREGIAMHIESSTRTSYYYNATDYSQRDRDDLLGTLVELLYDVGDEQVARHYPFLFGTDKFKHDGYEIGHLVIASIVSDYDMSFEDLLTTPVKDFAAYVETEL